MGRPLESPGSSYTLTESDLISGTMYLNPSAAINITLPAAFEDVNVYLFNVAAAFDITLKRPDATTLELVVAGTWVRIYSYVDSSGVPQWDREY